MTETTTAKSLEERESAVLARERALDLRERHVTELEDALHERDTLGTTKSELAAVAELQLREANGRLVAAAVRAHEMAEAAEVAKAQNVPYGEP